MSSALKTVTEREYFVREREASFKSEYLRGEVFAMAGGSPNHSLIAANWVREAGNSLKEKPCNVFNSDLRVKVLATGLITYPDASIVCGELEYADGEKDTVTNPAVIVEVLSSSTEKYDRGTKSGHYRQMSSLKELILVSQDKYHVEQYLRQADGSWRFSEQKELGSHFKLVSLGIEIAMAELYRGVNLIPPE